jgi:hypothetical protein
MKIIIHSLAFILIVNCAPLREDASELDVIRIIDRISIHRFSNRLENEDVAKFRSDREIFLEACEIYRLKPNSILEKIKISNPELYSRLKDPNEK